MSKKEQVETPEEVLYRLCDRIDEFEKKCKENKLNPEDPELNAFLTLRISDLLIVARVLDDYLGTLEEKEAAK